MKNFISVLFLITIVLSADGQNVSESNISVGMSKTTSSLFKRNYVEEPPTFLIFNGSKSWYSMNNWISLRKEAGLNFQYASIDFSSGGLGAGSHVEGDIISLFANASLQARMRITNPLAIGIGPEAEILLIGLNNLRSSYFNDLFPAYYNIGNENLHGLNRDYFNQPAYGIRLSIYESAPISTTTIGLHFSYLWTKGESSNFYTDNYSRISLVIGFKKQKEEISVKPVE